jgi:ribonuclease HI
MVSVYTDGACKSNPGRGGWGWIEFRLSGECPIIFYCYGGEKNTTNNRMELMALIQYLKDAPKGEEITIYSDSQYVLQGIVKLINGKGSLRKRGDFPDSHYTGWLKGWLVKDFEGVKNPDLWKELHLLITDHILGGTLLNFEYVRGHSGIKGNEVADGLANIGVESI